jgi:hypothetical protein
VPKPARVLSCSGVVSLIAAFGWPVVVLALVTVALTVVAITWLLSDHDRASRLIRLVREVRRRQGP